MSSSVGSVFGGIQKKIDGLGSSLAKVKRQSADITRLQTAQARLADASAKGNATAVARYSEQVNKLSSSLRAAGVDTSKLTAEQARLAGQIRGMEGQLGRLQRWNTAWSGLKTNALSVGAAFGKVKDNITGLATKLGVLGTAAGYLFKTQFVDTAAEFERLQTVLKTLEGGDVTKAKQAFGWINDFAAKTPYDLKTVTEAFVKLRAYGIDPIKGNTLRSLGDTASAMGKSVMDAVEAIADAVTGENERLKEFGIKAAKEGGKIIYSFTDKAGKQRQKVVDASNREMIRSTLTAIWNEKYAGAMDEQSRTWQGMMSNLSDQWTRFTARVMASGLFDWMKGKLGGLLEELNRAAEDGRLQKWAEETGKAIKEFFVNAWELGKSIKEVATSAAEFVGGWKNLGLILGAVALAPTIASVIQLGIAVGGLLGPWGLLAVAIIGALTAAYKFRYEIQAWLAMQPKWLSGLLLAFNPLAALVVYWDQISASVMQFKVIIGNAIDWAIQKIDALFEKLKSLSSLSIGGVSLGDVTSKFLDFNPLGPARFIERQLMPADGMPAPASNNVQQTNNITVNAPSSDPQAIAKSVVGSMVGAPLFDTTGVRGPK